MVRAVIIGTLIGVLVCTLLLILTSVLFVKMQSIPTNIIGIITQLFAAVSAFAAGFVSVRIIRAKGMVVGAVTGFFLFILILLAGLLSTTSTVTFATLTKGIIMCLCGSIGGIFAVNKKQKVR